MGEVMSTTTDKRHNDLINSIVEGNIDRAKSLIKKLDAGQIYRTDIWGYSYLDYVFAFNRVELIAQLKKFGYDLNHTPQKSDKAAINISVDTKADTLKAFTAEGGNIDVLNRNGMASFEYYIFRWAEHQKPEKKEIAQEIALIFLEGGADPNLLAKDEEGKEHTLLEKFIVTCTKETIEFIFGLFQSLDKKGIDYIKFNKRPDHLFVAAQATADLKDTTCLDKLAILTYLVQEQNYDINLYPTKELEPFKLTLLHMASDNHTVPVIEEIIRLGADVKAVTIHNTDALYHVLFNKMLTSTEKKEVIKMLLDSGIDVTTENYRFNTSFMEALFDAQPELALAIGEQREEVLNIPDRYGHLPLHISCRESFIDISELALNGTSDINSQTVFGETAFDIALRSNSSYCVDELLKDDRFDVNAIDHLSNEGFIEKLHNYERLTNKTSLFPNQDLGSIIARLYDRGAEGQGIMDWLSDGFFTFKLIVYKNTKLPTMFATMAQDFFYKDMGFDWCLQKGVNNLFILVGISRRININQDTNQEHNFVYNAISTITLTLASPLLDNLLEVGWDYFLETPTTFNYNTPINVTHREIGEFMTKYRSTYLAIECFEGDKIIGGLGAESLGERVICERTYYESDQSLKDYIFTIGVPSLLFTTLLRVGVPTWANLLVTTATLAGVGIYEHKYRLQNPEENIDYDIKYDLKITPKQTYAPKELKQTFGYYKFDCEDLLKIDQVAINMRDDFGYSAMEKLLTNKQIPILGDCRADVVKLEQECNDYYGKSAVEAKADYVPQFCYDKHYYSEVIRWDLERVEFTDEYYLRLLEMQTGKSEYLSITDCPPGAQELSTIFIAGEKRSFCNNEYYIDSGRLVSELSENLWLSIVPATSALGAYCSIVPREYHKVYYGVSIPILIYQTARIFYKLGYSYFNNSPEENHSLIREKTPMEEDFILINANKAKLDKADKDNLLNCALYHLKEQHLYDNKLKLGEELSHRETQDLISARENCSIDEYDKLIQRLQIAEEPATTQNDAQPLSGDTGNQPYDEL
jgi:ankyrin repeat protein